MQQYKDKCENVKNSNGNEYGLLYNLSVPFIKQISLPSNVSGKPSEVGIKKYIEKEYGYRLMAKRYKTILQLKFSVYFLIFSYIFFFSTFSPGNHFKMNDIMSGSKYFDVNTSSVNCNSFVRLNLNESMEYSVDNTSINPNISSFKFNNNLIKFEDKKYDIMQQALISSSQRNCAKKFAISASGNFLDRLIPRPKNFIGTNNPFKEIDNKNQKFEEKSFGVNKNRQSIKRKKSSDLNGNLKKRRITYHSLTNFEINNKIKR